MQVRQCDMGVCNVGVVGLWGKWTEWSACSASCGPGIRIRNRFCTKVDYIKLVVYMYTIYFLRLVTQ